MSKLRIFGLAKRLPAGLTQTYPQPKLKEASVCNGELEGLSQQRGGAR